MRKSLFIAFSSALILLLTPGCVQWHCCAYPYYNYVCVRGTDTAYVYIASSSNINTVVSDSLNWYMRLGYACYNNRNKEPWQATMSCMKDGLSLAHAKSAGLQCVDFNGTSPCNGDNCGY